jgi:hypothetical protein
MLSHDVVLYARARLLTPSFLAICGICAAFVLAFKGSAPIAQAAPVVGSCLSALVGFRLWDDLADLALDRQRHPVRMLCRIEHLAPFRLLAAGGVAFPLLTVWQAPQAAWTYLLYCLSLAVTYALTQPVPVAVAGSSRVRNVRVAVVLLKYPVVCLSALLALHALAQDTAVILALFLLYAAVAIHEVVSSWMSDHSSRTPG